MHQKLHERQSGVTPKASRTAVSSQASKTVKQKSELRNLESHQKCVIVIFVYCSLPFLAYILHNAYLILHVASRREVNTMSATSQPQVKPSQPKVRPSEFQVNPSQSKVKLTQPDINPSRPQVKQSQPQVKACACIYSHTYVCLSLEPKWLRKKNIDIIMYVSTYVYMNTIICHSISTDLGCVHKCHHTCT